MQLGALDTTCQGGSPAVRLWALSTKLLSREGPVAATQDSLPRLTRAGCENRSEFPMLIFYEAFPLEKNPQPKSTQVFASAR